MDTISSISAIDSSDDTVSTPATVRERVDYKLWEMTPEAIKKIVKNLDWKHLLADAEHFAKMGDKSRGKLLKEYYLQKDETTVSSSGEATKAKKGVFLTARSDYLSKFYGFGESKTKSDAASRDAEFNSFFAEYDI